jgi:predicted DNA-binding transcriptional regulator AlpA
MTLPVRHYPPRGMRSPEAAAYLGMGETKFRALVEAGRLPRPATVDGMVIWDRFDLDGAFDELKSLEGRPNTFDMVLGGKK